MSLILEETGDSLMKAVSRKMTVIIRKAIKEMAEAFVLLPASARSCGMFFSHSLMLAQM